MNVKTLNYWRAHTSGCSSFGEKVREIQKQGISGGRAIMLAKKLSTPEQFNAWMRRERAHDYEEKRRRRALGGSATSGFRFIGA